MDIAIWYYVDFGILLLSWSIILQLCTANICYSLANRPGLHDHSRIEAEKQTVKAVVFKILGVGATFPDFVANIDPFRRVQAVCEIFAIWFIIWSISNSFKGVFQSEYFQILDSTSMKSFGLLRRLFRRFCQHIDRLAYISCLFSIAGILARTITGFRIVDLWREAAFLMFMYTIEYARRKIWFLLEKLHSSFLHFRDNILKKTKSKPKRIYILKTLTQWRVQIAEMRKLHRGTGILLFVTLVLLIVHAIFIYVTTSQMNDTSMFDVDNMTPQKRYTFQVNDYIDSLYGQMCICIVIYFHWKGWQSICVCHKDRKKMLARVSQLSVVDDENLEKEEVERPQATNNLNVLARKIYQDIDKHKLEQGSKYQYTITTTTTSGNRTSEGNDTLDSLPAESYYSITGESK